MTKFTRPRVVAAALIACALTASTPSFADIKNYQFQLVDNTVKVGPTAIITVRLIEKTTGKPVPNAVIFATHLDMTPEGMPTMSTSLTPMPGAEPGTFRFKADVSMAGKWQLSLGAKVQGETGTVESKLVIPAQK